MSQPRFHAEPSTPIFERSVETIGASYKVVDTHPREYTSSQTSSSVSIVKQSAECQETFQQLRMEWNLSEEL